MFTAPTPLGEEEERRVHRCPQCRKTFTLGPVPEKNTMLAALVETLVKTGLHADHCYAGAEAGGTSSIVLTLLPYRNTSWCNSPRSSRGTSALVTMRR